MCDKGEYKRMKIPGRSRPLRIDKCIVDHEVLFYLNKYTGFRSIACCCGHGVFHPTIIVDSKHEKDRFELLSGVELPIKNNYYRYDKESGIYYLPEVEEYYNGSDRS